MKQLKYLTRVEPGEKVRLKKIDPDETGDIDKDGAKARLKELSAELSELQQLLYAASTHSILIVLQALDTGGKDGTIRNVLGGINPLGCHIVGFRAPSETELKHDFLWRIHQETPARGKIGVFNRSHYEDVLVARVRELVPPQVWKARYEQINDFEKLLAANNTIILKFYLHISLDEQKERLLAREAEVAKAWKLSVDDWGNRKLWDAYQSAYEDALTKCSTSYAPWHIVPANHKWFRNLAVSNTIVEALRPLKKGWLKYLEQQSQERLAELKEYREQGGATEL